MEPPSAAKANDTKKRPPASAFIDLTKEEQGFSKDSAIDLTEFVEHGNEKRKAHITGHQDDNNSGNKRKRQTAKTTNNISARVFDCSICLETVDSFQGYALSACRHAFCRSCLHGYIQSKISSKQVQPHQLKRPHIQCGGAAGGRLNHADVRACTLELGDAKGWQEFQEAATETFLDAAIAASSSSVSAASTAATSAVGQAVLSSSSMRRCPTDHCNFTFQYDTPNHHHQLQGQLFICPKCSQAYCLHCPVVQGSLLAVGPAHDDTCSNVLEQVRQSQERQRKLEEWKRENTQADARFQELLQSEAKRGLTRPCPKYQTPITKNGGCNHMHCTSCSFDFNWSQAAKKHW